MPPTAGGGLLESQYHKWIMRHTASALCSPVQDQIPVGLVGWRNLFESFPPVNSIQFNLDFTDRINRKRGVVKSGNNK